MKRRKTSHPEGRHARKVLAVRVLAAKVAWLDGAVRWTERGFAWTGRRGTVVPGPAELARAERTLNTVRQYPVAGPQALGDADAWQARMRGRLDLARALSRLDLSEADALAALARQRRAEALPRLMDLLLAEAVCAGPLPLRPSRLIAGYGDDACPALLARLSDGCAQEPCRALAALVLGAMRARPGPQAGLRGVLADAYELGERAGLAELPAVSILLLGEPRGLELASRWEAAAGVRHALSVAPDALAEMLAHGAAPASVVELAEASREGLALAERLADYRSVLPEPSGSARRRSADERRKERDRVTAALAQTLARCAATGEPGALRAALALVGVLLDLGGPVEPLVDGARAAIDAALTSIPGQAAQALQLLLDCHAIVWHPGTTPQPAKTARGDRGLWKEWMRERWDTRAAAALQALRASGSLDVARRMVQTRIDLSTRYYEYREAGILAVLMGLVDRVGPLETMRPYHTLAWLFTAFRTADEARRATAPLVSALLTLPAEERAHLLKICQPGERKPDALRAMRLALPSIVALMRGPEHGAACYCTVLHSLAEACVSLDEAAALAWLQAAREAIQRTTARSARPVLTDGVLLACRLAGGDIGLFVQALAAELPEGTDEAAWRAQPGATELAGYPTVRRALVALLAEEPRRCLGLLDRVGGLRRLGPSGPAPLRRLAGLECTDAEVDELQPDWRAVLELVPEHEATARRLLLAREVLGEPPTLPPGISKAMRFTQRLREQLACVERGVPGMDERQAEARRARLMARLQDDAQLRASIAKDLRPRLERAADEAVLQALGGVLDDCYMARLNELAAPLPSGVALDDDLVNAVLLGAQIESNKKLLRTLIRAHLDGDVSWRERVSANGEFMRDAGDHGVDVERWLSRSPGRYRCVGARHDRVRIWLETEPIRILQMGNPFGTCLREGGMNAFSTVANAVELNKRVIYASDAGGRIVGRKLIGISQEWKLVGFCTYTTLPNRDANLALERAILRYSRRFARRCRIEMADAGTVPRLFAEDWYDDGACAWSVDETDGGQESRSRAGNDVGV